jgi:hypothetical protein
MDWELRKVLCCSFFLVACALQAQNPNASASNDSQAVTIVELFTSEGCSSCPPADELLKRVNLTRVGAGQLVVGLSEHVTYWDRLGWRDPFSQEVFTERQTAYATRFSLDSPYTPQMVVNGEVQFVGSDAASLANALRATRPQNNIYLNILSAAVKPDGVELRFSINPSRKDPVSVYAAVTDDLDKSNVLRGENSGRSLQHASVVRSFTRVNLQGDVAEQVAHVALPRDFDRSGKASHHIVVFAQQPHEGAIVRAAAIPLL